MLLYDCLAKNNVNKHKFNYQVDSKLYFKYGFNSYGEALDAYLDKECGRGAKKKLAELLVDDPEDEKKVHSKQVEIGRWTGGGADPIDRTKQEINEKLNIRIVRKGINDWYVLSGDDEFIQKTDQLSTLLDKNNISREELDEILLSIRGRSLALSRDLEEFADWVQKIRSE